MQNHCRPRRDGSCQDSAKETRSLQGTSPTRLEQHADAAAFSGLVATDHGVTTTEYEKNVKQPMDLGTIRKKLDLEPGKLCCLHERFRLLKGRQSYLFNVTKNWLPGTRLQTLLDAFEHGGWMSGNSISTSTNEYEAL